MEYSKKESNKRESLKKKLIHTLNETEKQLATEPQNENLQQKSFQLKKELELYEIKHAKGAQVRSRVKWIEEGEKNTKYFLRLEKHRNAINTIANLKIGNDCTDDPALILEEIKTFYEDLYKEKSQREYNTKIKNHFLSDELFPILSDEERAECDKVITREELTQALKLLNKDSAPGSDGLPPSFYEKFWEKLQLPLIKCILQSVDHGELPFSLKSGVITLIHKGKDLDRNNLSNYRPITLTNTDYKIFTKALALRLQKVITSVVNEDQVGFVKGRNIASHLRLFDDLSKYLCQNNKSGALVALDFSKAFDTLSKQCITEALDIFNFGPNFQNLVLTAMKGTQSCVQNGGWLSNWFPTERGIRQGCPLSPLLFILAVEILAIKIRNSEDIKGIQVEVNTHQHTQTTTSKIKQFADDTTLTMRNENDVNKAIAIVEDFKQFSGLSLNKHKSEGIWLGSRKHERGTVNGIPMQKIIKILGIYYSSEKEASLVEENWNSKLENVLRTIKQWENRNPTLYGKVILAKTLLL